jgi:hypothetical protein
MFRVRVSILILILIHQTRAPVGSKGDSHVPPQVINCRQKIIALSCSMLELVGSGQRGEEHLNGIKPTVQL